MFHPNLIYTEGALHEESEKVLGGRGKTSPQLSIWYFLLMASCHGRQRCFTFHRRAQLKPGPQWCAKAPAWGAGRQPVADLTVDTSCLCSLDALSLDFLDKPLVITCQGTSAASLILLLLQILILLPNASIFSKFTSFIVINHHAKLLAWLHFSSTEKPGARLGSVLFNLSQVSSLAKPSYAKNHVSKTFLLPSAVTRLTWSYYYLRLWVVGQGGHPPTKCTYLVFPMWIAVGQRFLLMPPTWGRPQIVHRAQTTFLSLSLWFSKIEANILLHVEMCKGEGKETGEQKQDKR